MKTKLTTIFLLFILSVWNIHAQTTQLWGTTRWAGANGLGSIYKTDLNGTNFQVAYSFMMPNECPVGNLALANNGKLYGVTAGIGSYDGSIYSYNPLTGVFTVIYQFNPSPQSGSYAYTGMVKANNGTLYGVCVGGGAYGYGIIYKIDPVTDTYTDVYDFNNNSGGFYPGGTLIQANNGKLYGMTQAGGTNGDGVIFSFDPISSTYIKLYDFDLVTTGRPAHNGLIQAPNSILYGTTHDGGTNNAGILFSFDIASGNFINLHDFDSIHGSSPEANLVQAANGILYGMTNEGGTNNKGVIFSFDITTNTYTDLLDFDGLNGTNPHRGLTLASNNKLYGTTMYGGIYDEGVVFNYDIASNTYTKLLDFYGCVFPGPPDGEFIERPVQSPTSIAETNNTSNLYIFPNPATSTIQLTFNTKHNGAVQCEIWNVMGERVYEAPLPASPRGGEESTAQVDVSFLAKGIYVVRVGDGSQWENKKLVVE